MIRRAPVTAQRPYSELVREAEKARLLLDAARQLGETLEPERVYTRFRELLADVVEHDGVIVSSYEDSDGLIRCDYAWSDGEQLDASRLPPLPLNRKGGGMQSRVIVTGEALLFNDVPDVVQHEPGVYYDVDRKGTMRKIPDTGPPKTRAAMMVPVKHEGAVVGVVQLMSDRAEYTAEQLELVEGLVGQMAAAVRIARLRKERSRLEAAEAAARAVAAEREQAASVLEAVGDGIFLVDDHGCVRLWNRAAETVTGLRAGDVRDRPLAAALASWAELVDRIPVAEGGSSPRSVTLPVAVEGRELWLSFVAVRGSAGVVYAFRDLTSERRLEEEKTDLVATISHELRTPMAAVYGAAETLLHRDDLEPEQRRELLAMIAAQATRLTAIVESVLLASRLDRDVVAVEREPVDVAELARATVEALRPQLPPSLELELEVGAEEVRAAGDADRIQQVLVNLLDNAVKYGEGGPVTVRVRPANGVVCLSVQDSGPGLAPAEQARVFDKFYRAGPQLTRTGGTGLGLYISRELVRRMGGRLDVRSKAGAGATFVLELPRA
jgi:two-component system, OmpR family, phosphate regulon sensor histidine kinase PhoR